MLVRMSLIFMLLLLGTYSSHSEELKKTVLPQRLKQILEWLPTDSESLIVANGRFPISYESGLDRPFVEFARPLSCSLVTALQDGLLKEHLQSEKVLIAVEGSRRFTAPKYLGLMSYEGCQILCFDDGAHVAFQAAVKLCFEKASKTIQLGKTKVAVFTEQWENDQWTILVAQPQPGVLLCATNQKYLEEILVRMNRKHKNRAFPDHLPEWQYVNVEASVWGIRHYSKEFVKTDPSSPFRGPAAVNVPDIDAIGFVFWYDVKKDQNARAYYLSKSDAALKIMLEEWQYPEEKLTPEVKEIKPGIIEISEPVGEDHDAWYMFLLLLMERLGHGVYL